MAQLSSTHFLSPSLYSRSPRPFYPVGMPSHLLARLGRFSPAATEQCSRHGSKTSTSSPGSKFSPISSEDGSNGYSSPRSDHLDSDPFSLHDHFNLDLPNLAPCASSQAIQSSISVSSEDNDMHHNSSVHLDATLEAPTILVLGSQNSGKSTLIKQLVLRYGTEKSLQLLQDSCRASLYCRLIDEVRQALSHCADHLPAYGTAILRLRLAPILSLSSTLPPQLLPLQTHYSASLVGPSQSAASVAPHIFGALAQDIQDLLANRGSSIDP